MALVYVHIPFCIRKCSYCDFYSIPLIDEQPSILEEYCNCLKREIYRRAETLSHRETVDTLYFGGGTPSLLPPEELASIIHSLASVFTISKNAEVTLEVNPGTVTRDKLRAYRQCGVNRLSIGVQSFHDDELRFLGRIHTAADARTCIENAFEAGYTNVSVDILIALPSQSKESLLLTLGEVTSYNIHHVSCYTLMVEPNTHLYELVRRGSVIPVDDDTEAEFYLTMSEYLRSKGYVHYEVSNFAKPGYECRHNCGYWNHTQYFGFGPSAHSYYKKKRWWNIADLKQYCTMLRNNRLPLAGGEELTDEQFREEMIYLGLRSTGIIEKEYEELFHEKFTERYQELVKELVEQNLALYSDGRFRLTSQGYALCDEICQRFL